MTYSGSLRERLGELAHADSFKVGAEGEARVTGMDDEAPRGLQVVACDVESPLGLGRQAAFDLDRPALSLGQVEHEIDLRACRSPVETRERPLRRNREQVLDDETLPARAH